MENKFNQTDLLPPLVALEFLLLNVSNGPCFQEQLDEVKASYSMDDFNFNHLQRHLSLLVDVVKQGLPIVNKVANIHTICEAMNSEPTISKIMLSEVHKLLGLYLTIPISSATSQKAISVLKHVLT